MATETKIREIFVKHFQKYLPYLLNGSTEKFRKDAEEAVNELTKLIEEEIKSSKKIINNKNNNNGRKTT